MTKLVVVVPTIRPDQHAEFVKAWTPLLRKYSATLVTVWDGDEQYLDRQDYFPDRMGSRECLIQPGVFVPPGNRNLFCRWTDSCRNLGFAYAARLGADVVLTLDDDVRPLLPPIGDDWRLAPDDPNDRGQVAAARCAEKALWRAQDPIRAHLDALDGRVPVSWMNTAHQGVEYLRGFPYGVREEAPVMVSHGVWDGVPDFDGETQLRLEGSADGLPGRLPYYVGPVPRGVFFSMCGMNLAFRREMLPHIFFAPMGPDSGFHDLHRFGDIWAGLWAKAKLDREGWALYTGAATVRHSRASDARKNAEAEKLGVEWNEWVWKWVGKGIPITGLPDGLRRYAHNWVNKAERYAMFVESLQAGAS